MPPLQRF